jgi:hypothetical protein
VHIPIPWAEEVLVPRERRDNPRISIAAEGQLIFESCSVLPYFVPVRLQNASRSGVLLSTGELIEVGRRTELCIGFGRRQWLEVQRLVDTGTDGPQRFQIGARVIADAPARLRAADVLRKVLAGWPQLAWNRPS